MALEVEQGIIAAVVNTTFCIARYTVHAPYMMIARAKNMYQCRYIMATSTYRSYLYHRMYEHLQFSTVASI